LEFSPKDIHDELQLSFNSKLNAKDHTGVALPTSLKISLGLTASVRKYFSTILCRNEMRFS